MRIGLIGAGRIGSNHARLLAGIGEVEAILVADVASERAEMVAAGIPTAAVASVDAVFESGVDGVLIASSTDTHAELLRRAAAAGLPAFCEKPIALDLASTEEAVAAVDAAGITVQMGFQRRYDPGIRAVGERVASGDIGVPYLVRSQTHDPAPPPLEYVPHSGGIFKDCLIHDIDAVRYVTGQEVVSAHATGSGTGHPEIDALGDFGSATAILELSGGTIAQLSGLRHDPMGYDVRLEVFAPGAALAAGWSERTPIVSVEPGVAAPVDPIRSFWDRFDAAYRAELEAFLRVIAGDELPAANHHDAYEDLRVATACAISAREGRTVRLEEID